VCQLFCVATVALSLVGVARVWLSVRATEVSREASEIRADIKSERYEGDLLEVRQSALSSPSRIGKLAGGAMDMAPAASVTYLDLTKRESRARVGGHAATGTSGLESVLAELMDLTAGEAQVLLVGDVGLASTP
jgi:hypothetical protein